MSIINQQVIDTLLYAIKSNNYKLVKEIITLGNDINPEMLKDENDINPDTQDLPIKSEILETKINKKYNPFTYAIEQKSSLAIIKLLVTKKLVNVEILFDAIHKYNTKERAELLKLIIKLKPELLTSRGRRCCTPLMCAIASKLDINEISLLMYPGCDVDIDTQGNTPLIIAIYNKLDINIIKLFATPEAIKKVNKRDITPLLTSLSKKSPIEVVKLLATPEMVTYRFKDGETHLMRAFRYLNIKEHREIFEAISTPEVIEMVNNDGMTALMYAIGSDNIYLDDDFMLSLITPSTIRTKSMGECYPYEFALLTNLDIKLVNLLYFPGAINKNYNGRAYEYDTMLNFMLKECDNLSNEHIEFVLKEKPDLLKIRNKGGCTPIGYALYKQMDDDIIKTLAKYATKEVLMTPIEKGDFIPLIYAIRRERSESVIESLLFDGAKDIKYNYRYGDDNSKFLFEIATEYELSSKFTSLKPKDPLTSKDLKGDTPLLRLLNKGNYTLEEVQKVSSPEAIRITDKNGNTPLMIAANSRAKIDVLKYLMYPGSIEQVNDNGDTALTCLLTNIYGYGADSVNLLSTPELLLQPNKKGEIPLIVYVKYLNYYNLSGFNIDILKILISSESLRHKDKWGKTAFMHCVENGFSLNIFDLLHYKGAELETNNEGKSFLHLAVHSRHPYETILKYLKSKTVKLQDKYGRTALMDAIYNNKDIDVISLLATDNSINIKDNEGNTALMYAIRGDKDIGVISLLKNNYTLTTKNDIGETPLMFIIKKIIANGYNSKMASIARILMTPKSARIKDKDGNTALSYVINHGKIYKDIIKLLAIDKKSLYIRNKEGETPLMSAIRVGASIDICNLLIDKYSVSIANKKGETPLIYVTKHYSDNKDLINLILSNIK